MPVPGYPSRHEYRPDSHFFPAFPGTITQELHRKKPRPKSGLIWHRAGLRSPNTVASEEDFNSTPRTVEMLIILPLLGAPRQSKTQTHCFGNAISDNLKLVTREHPLFVVSMSGDNSTEWKPRDTSKSDLVTLSRDHFAGRRTIFST